LPVAVVLGVVAPVARAEPSPATSPAHPLDRLVRPVLLDTVDIEYPRHLLEPGPAPAGRVLVRFKIDPDGIPRDIAIEQGLHEDLDALAVAAVARLRYRPAEFDGVPVAVIDRIAIDFAPPLPPPPATRDEPTFAPAEPVAESLPPADEGGSVNPERESLPVNAQPPNHVEGRILEAGQRTPLAGVTVIAVPAAANTPTGEIRKTDYAVTLEPSRQIHATTDARGRFALHGVPDGTVRIVIVAPGFERLEFVERVAPNETLEVQYYAPRLQTNPYRTVVRTEVVREEVARRTIRVEEINSLPGTQGDALKALQNFPGVARAPLGLGALLVRGTGPNDSAIYLGHHPIPQLFHFGGLTSVFNSDMLERIDFIPGNFDSRYGDAVGGVIDVTPRAGRRDGVHGYIDADVFDSGFLVEGPVGKGSFALSARRSYIDALLPLVVPDDAGLGLTLAPRYYDYQASIDYPLGGGMFTARVFGSDDRLSLVAASPNDVDTDARERFENTLYFHRVDLAYERRQGPWHVLVTPSYRIQFIELSISDIARARAYNQNLALRAEFTRRLSRRSDLSVGTESQIFWYDATVTTPPIGASAGPGADQISTKIDAVGGIPTIYATATLRPTPAFTLFPGVRASLYTYPKPLWLFEPRLRFRVALGDRTSVKGGVGLHGQAAEPQEADDVLGNPNLGLEYALQSSLGVERQFAYDIDLDATAFFNVQWDGVIPSDQTVLTEPGGVYPEYFQNNEMRRIYGLEILLRKALTRNLFGWIAYTLSRSERRDGDDWFLFDFDQTHILTIVGVYALPRNWQIGLRFRLVSGNPDTPFLGSIYDASAGSYLPVPGARTSDRLPMFHQLDLRVDKQWITKRVKWRLYLDIQNAYNARNVEFWNYAYDFSQREPIAGLPIIPSLGVKLEF